VLLGMLGTFIGLVITLSSTAQAVSATADLAALRALASYVSRRSAAIVAASVFALWELKREEERAYLRALLLDSDDNNDDENNNNNNNRAASFIDETRAEMARPETMVSFNGSVIEFYPDYLATCQRFINDLVASSLSDQDNEEEEEEERSTLPSVNLVLAKESSLLGAAVALACLEEGKAN